MTQLLIIFTILAFSLHLLNATTHKCANKPCNGRQYLSDEPDQSGCHYCKNYAKLGEHCSGETQCDPSLKCSHHDGNPICKYRWNTDMDHCSPFLCPRLDYCPEDTFFVAADQKTVCCNACVRYSLIGQYCDEKQLCRPGLPCVKNTCATSEDCYLQKQSCAPVTPENCWMKTSYILESNGLDRCCDSCEYYKNYSLIETIIYNCWDTYICEGALCTFMRFVQALTCRITDFSLTNDSMDEDK